MVLERYPHRPVIQDGFPKNITARPNATVTFSCPVIADLEVFIQWAKYPAFNDSDVKVWNNGSLLEVLIRCWSVGALSVVLYILLFGYG